jgi:uncharacterized metal-binding protein
MSDGRDGPERNKAGASRRGAAARGPTVLLYACSGGANVAEVSDRAARELMFAGEGTMFCLAGLGADIPSMVQTAREADLNLVIDGCPMDCAKKVFDRYALANYVQIKVTDLGIEKAKGVRCTPQEVDAVIAKARRVLSEALGDSS